MRLVETDVLILGAGAAGLLCGAEAGKRGRRTVVLDHAQRPGEKIRISGGGRCNFTNLQTAPDRFLSENPRFCVSALARYTPAHFVALVERYGIAYHEKSAGQLFCDGLAQQIVDMLMAENREAGVDVKLRTEVLRVEQEAGRFVVATSSEHFRCQSLVIALGGLSIPKMGASNLGYRLAAQFGLRVVPTEPALVPFTMAESYLQRWRPLSGVAAPAAVSCNGYSFRDALLFTHRGLSGPAILQISSYWKPGESVSVDLYPGGDLTEQLLAAKVSSPRQEPVTALTTILPKRLAQHLTEMHLPAHGKRLADVPNRNLMTLASAVQRWTFVPNGTEGYRTAEVTRGGVDTTELSSKTMEAVKVPGLYFIGEVVDVTGHLGGYNFQWAWASGYAAGQFA